MLILKRLSIWLCETSLEALLLALLLVILSGDNKHAYMKDVIAGFVWVSMMFFSTGYVFTTGLARAIWQPGKAWLYPTVATVLFFIHFEILNHAAGGIFTPAMRAGVQFVGAFIAFSCTLAGTFALGKWKTGDRKL